MIEAIWTSNSGKPARSSNSPRAKFKNVSNVWSNGSVLSSSISAFLPSPHYSRRLLLQPPGRKSELIAVFFLRARIIQRALDLASAVTTHLTAGGLRGGSGNSDSVVSGSLASPTPGRGGNRKERGDEEDETESRGDV